MNWGEHDTVLAPAEWRQRPLKIARTLTPGLPAVF